jgi:DNA invertase Pin-like site-specific DNA recombinase
MSETKRTVLYLRVSTSDQDVENQRRVLLEVAARRGWNVVREYCDDGISGSGRRDKRPDFDAMMKDATRRRFDVVMVWAIDRLGRSVATVSTALVDLDHAGVAIYADKEGMDATTPHGRAMLQMASVFAELERGMLVERINAGIARARVTGTKSGKPIGRAPASPKTIRAIRERLEAGQGIRSIARELGAGVSTVMRVRGGRAEMQEQRA